MNNKDKGLIGEEAAAEYLSSLGWDIVERNYTVRGGEIDIIALDGETLVFVEVKGRTLRADAERPAEAVDERKIAFLVRSAEQYVFQKNELCGEMPVRFDVVEVVLSEISSSGAFANINHIRNIDVY